MGKILRKIMNLGLGDPEDSRKAHIPNEAEVIQGNPHTNGEGCLG